MSAPADVRRRDAILAAIAYSAARLLREDGVAEGIDAVLEHLGQATGVDRVYVFEVARSADGALLASQRHEWAAPGVDPQIGNPELQQVPFEEAGFARWAEVLAEGEPIHGPVGSFPPSERELLEPQGIRSLVVVPVMIGSHWWGFMGFDDTTGVRPWSRSEVDALRAAAGVLGAGIQQHLSLESLRRSNEANLAAFRRERAAAQRLRELDDLKNAFLEAVSHELRTPLTAIRGFTETLRHREQALEEDLRRDLVVRLDEQAGKLDRLLGDLLDLNRLRRESMVAETTVVEVEPFLREVVGSCAALGTRRVDLDVRVERSSLDPVLAERILNVLLENAAVHTPPDAAVWVRAIPASEPGVLVVVEDDGPGVPEAHRQSIFEPFVHGPTRRPHSPGAGIGLSLVARFAVLHGGRAWVEEREGGGASFRVLLAP